MTGVILHSDQATGQLSECPVKEGKEIRKETFRRSRLVEEGLMRNTMSEQFFLEPVITAVPITIGRTGQEEEFGPGAAFEVHQGGVSAGRLPARVDVIQRCAASPGVLQVHRSVNAGRHGEESGMPERQPDRSLPPHAESHNSQPLGSDLPLLLHPGKDSVKEMLFWTDRGVEGRYGMLEPPGASCGGCQATPAPLDQRLRPARDCIRRSGAGIVEKQKSGRSWW